MNYFDEATAYLKESYRKAKKEGSKELMDAIGKLGEAANNQMKEINNLNRVAKKISTKTRPREN